MVKSGKPLKVTVFQVYPTLLNLIWCKEDHPDTTGRINELTTRRFPLVAANKG